MAREFIPGRGEPEPPSNTFSYFFREAWRRLWISKRTSFVAVAMIAISLMILGSFLLVAENLSHAVEQWQGKSRVNVYLDADATPDQVHAVEAWLIAHPDFAHRRFVTKAEALTRFKRDFTNLPEIFRPIDENPFPASFECQVTPRVVQSAAFDP